MYAQCNNSNDVGRKDVEVECAPLPFRWQNTQRNCVKERKRAYKKWNKIISSRSANNIIIDIHKNFPNKLRHITRFLSHKTNDAVHYHGIRISIYCYPSRIMFIFSISMGIFFKFRFYFSRLCLVPNKMPALCNRWVELGKWMKMHENLSIDFSQIDFPIFRYKMNTMATLRIISLDAKCESSEYFMFDSSFVHCPDEHANKL